MFITIQNSIKWTTASSLDKLKRTEQSAFVFGPVIFRSGILRDANVYHQVLNSTAMGTKVLKQLVRCKPALFSSRTMEIQQPSVVSKGQGKNINSYDSQKIHGVACSWAWLVCIVWRNRCLTLVMILLTSVIFPIHIWVHGLFLTSYQQVQSSPCIRWRRWVNKWN